MTTEQQIHQALIKNNFLKDKDSERGFAWIATCQSCDYPELQIELIGLHAKYFAPQERLSTDEAIKLWARLTGKTATKGNFTEHKTRAFKTGFKLAKDETIRGNGRGGHTTSYHTLAIYRLAQHTLK